MRCLTVSRHTGTPQWHPLQLRRRWRGLASMAWSDPYALLGVGRGCTEGELKKAYRKLALKHHPDTAAAKGTDPAQAEVMFKQVSQAYETILGQRARASVPSGGQQHAWGEKAYGQRTSKATGSSSGGSSSSSSSSSSSGGGGSSSVPTSTRVRTLNGTISHDQRESAWVLALCSLLLRWVS